MIIDKQNCFTTDYSGVAFTATGQIGDVIDLGLGDFGKSQDQALWIYVKVTEAYNNLTSIAFKFQTDDNAAMSSPTDLPIQSTVLLAGLTLNAELMKVKVPLGCERYIRLYGTVSGTAPTTGKIAAFLQVDLQASYA